MKKGILMMLAMLPGMVMATPTTPKPSIDPVNIIPARFVSSSETTTFEWGCPVAQVVRTQSESDAMLRVSKECMDEARRAAAEKHGVFEVINVSVIVPDVNVTKHAEGYMLTGTFFLETLVLKNME